MTEKLSAGWLDDDLDAWRQAGLHRRRRRLESASGANVRFQGREFVNFASNDYLNLAGDPRLARAAARAARRYGTGAGASALIAGYLPPLRRLERDLARWQGTEAALVTSSGFAANLGTLAALAGPDDAVFSDELNHASLIDGCRLSRARVHVYRHADVSHLEELLARETHARRRLIVSDSLFSMDGDLAPLPELADLAQRFDAVLVIDEAHALGVFGEAGRGLNSLPPVVDHPLENPSWVPGAEVLRSPGEAAASVGRGFGVPQPRAPRTNGGCWEGEAPAEPAAPLASQRRALARLDPERLIKVGTLSKALGAQGGFVCASKTVIDWLVNRARPYVFSTALAPPAAAAARRALHIVEAEPEPRRHLLELADLLRTRLRQAGFPDTRSQSQIIPFMVGDARRAVQLSKKLEAAGLLVPAIRPPTVPAGTSRLRVSLSAGHTIEDVDRLARALA